MESSILNINKYSKKSLKAHLGMWIIKSILISMVLLVFTRPYIIKLPSVVFYILTISILIGPIIILTIRSIQLRKKYTRKIDKNIKNLYEDLNNVYKDLNSLNNEYNKKLINKINSIDRKIKINLVSASSYINDEEIVQYELNQGVFNENKSEKKIFLDNESKLKYIEDTISIIDKFQNTDTYKYMESKTSNSLTTQYIPDGDYKKTIENTKPTFNIIQNYYNRRKKLLINKKIPLSLGIEGEKIVNEYLKIYKDEIINLPNIRLEVNGQSIENDNILITRKGIFILEVKNIGSTGSYSIRVEKDGRWLKVFNDNSTELIEFNATEQNDRHIAILQTFINNKLNRSIEKNNYLNIDGIVVIANNTVDIKNESTQNIYRISEIYRYINKFEDKLTYNEMLEIKEVIIKDKLKPKPYEILDYKSEIINNTKILNNIIMGLRYENQNLESIYTYLKDIGYIKWCKWLKQSNILKKIKNLKLEDGFKVQPTQEVLKEIGIPLDINIHKNELNIVSMVVISALSIIIISMKLVSLPQELTPILYKKNYGYTDECGIPIVGPKYDSASEFIGGIGCISVDNKYGAIDSKGREIIRPIYDELEYLKDGLYAVSKDGKYGIVDKTGKEILPCEYQMISIKYEGTYVLLQKNNKYGILNPKTKNIEADVKYQKLEEISNGLIKVKLNGKYGFLSKKTYKELLEPKYDYIDNYSYNGLREVRLNNKIGFINDKYELVIPTEYDEIIENIGGKVRLKKNGKSYYIDINNLDNLVSCANEISGKWNINGNQYITYVHGTGQESNIILNDKKCSDIQVETDIQIGGSMLFGTSGNAGILFRSDKNAENAYFIMIQSINGGEILLGKFNPEWEVIARASTNIRAGTTYKLKVEAKGNNIKAYIGDMEKPLIDIIDDTFTSGYIGLRAWDADAGFENINARKY